MLNILEKGKNKPDIILPRKTGVVVSRSQPPPSAPFEGKDFFDYTQEGSIWDDRILAVNRLPYKFEISSVRSLNPADKTCRKQKIILAIFPKGEEKFEIRPFSSTIAEIEAAKIRFNLNDVM